LIEAAVASALSARVGAEREHEFDVSGVVGELAFGGDVAAVGVEEAGLLIDAAAVPFVLAGAVEEDDGAFGGLHAERVAFAGDLLELRWLLVFHQRHAVFGDDGAEIGLADWRKFGRGRELK